MIPVDQRAKYICLSLLCCFLLQRSGYASTSVCTDSIVVVTSFSDPSPVIDGSDPYFSDRKLIYLGGNFEHVIVRNLVGTPDAPITITTLGPVTIGSTTGYHHSLTIEDCQYLEVSGTTQGAEEDSEAERLLQITNAPQHRFGLVVAGHSHHIDIHHLDIQNQNGFAGVGIKNSPDGDPLEEQTNECDDPGLSHIRIHHNRVHNVEGTGEGIYVGDSFFLGRGDGSTTTSRNAHCPPFRYPQPITHIEIDHNEIENIAWDGIQLGSAIAGCSIHDNTIINYGAAGTGTQANGIQIGEGCQGLACYNNFIDNDAPTYAGHGIMCLGAGNNTFYNNVIVDPAESGIYVKEVKTYRTYGEQAAGAYYELCDVLDQTAGGSVFLHNTIVRPADYGIQLFRGNLYGTFTCMDGSAPDNQATTTLPGGYAVNNLVVNDKYLAFYNAVGPITGPMSAQDILSQSLEEIRSTNLTLFTETEGFGTSADDPFFVAPQLGDYTLRDDFLPRADYHEIPSATSTGDFYARERRPGTVDFGAIERQGGGLRATPTQGEWALVTESVIAYPNPTRHAAELRFTAMTAGEYQLQIVNAQGRVMSTSHRHYDRGGVSRRIEDDLLPQPGLYRLRVTTPEGRQLVTTLVRL